MASTGRRGHDRKTEHGTVHVRPHQMAYQPGQAAKMPSTPASRADALRTVGELGLSSLAGLLVWAVARMVLTSVLALTVAITVAALAFIGWSVLSPRRKPRYRFRTWRRRKVRRMRRRVRLVVYHGWRRATGHKVMASTKYKSNRVRLQGLPSSDQKPGERQ